METYVSHHYQGYRGKSNDYSDKQRKISIIFLNIKMQHLQTVYSHITLPELIVVYRFSGFSSFELISLLFFGVIFT